MFKNLSSKLLDDRNTIIFISIFIFFLLLFCSHMSPLYYSNEWADVNVYFNIGKAIFNGKVLYVDVFDHKGPLIFFIYGLGYLLSNNSFLGVFFIELAAWSVMCYFIYRIGKLYLNYSFSYLLAIIFPVLLVKLFKAGGSAEEFILVCEIISLYYFISYFKSKETQEHRPYHMLIHGVMCSAVFFIKINLIMFWFFPLVGIFISLLIAKKYKNILLNIAAFICGFLLIALPICLYLVSNNALEEAYNVYIDLNRKYAELQTIGDSLTLLVYRLLFLYMDPFSLLLMPLIGVFYFPFKHLRNVIGRVVFILTGFTLYGVIYISPVFQYYYPLPFLVFTLIGLLCVFYLFANFLKCSELHLKHILIISIVINYLGLSQKNLNQLRTAGVLTSTPGLLTQNMHNEIVKHQNPTLLNLGFGLGNSLFTTCNIVPNVRYFFSPNLTYDSYPQLRDEQTRYIENKMVDFILIPRSVLSRHSSSLTKKRKISNIDYFMNLPSFQQNYSLILSDTILNEIDESNLEVYFLYKRNN